MNKALGVIVTRVWWSFLLAALITSVSWAARPTLEPKADPKATWKASGMVEVLYNHRDVCWTGPAPKDMEGEIPGHVIIRNNDGLENGNWFYAGDKAVVRALDHVFKDKHPDMDVLAFCR